MADVLGKSILVPANGDASFGAAALAGIGVGLYDGTAEQSTGAPCSPDARTIG